MGQRLLRGQQDQLPDLLGALFRNGVQHQLPRLLPEDAQRPPVPVHIDLSALDLPGALSHADELQRCGVDGDHVSAGAGKRDRAVQRDAVQIVPRQEPRLILKLIVVPAAAADPGAGLNVMLLDIGAAPPHHLLDAVRRVQAHILQEHPQRQHVHVGIAERRRHCALLHIDALCVTGGLRQLGQRADGLNGAVLHQHGLRAGQLFIDRNKIAVIKEFLHCSATSFRFSSKP